MAIRPQPITIAHSPDADDAFMFYALSTGKVGSPQFQYTHILRDIQSFVTISENTESNRINHVVMFFD